MAEGLVHHRGCLDRDAQLALLTELAARQTDNFVDVNQPT